MTSAMEPSHEDDGGISVLTPLWLLPLLSDRLAATIGPRSGLSRLSKKEVNGVDIVRTW